jgi:hypothetical protein
MYCARPHGAGIAARQDGLGIVRRRGFEARRDLVERFVPADAAELAFSLCPSSLQRVLKPVRCVGAFQVVRDLRAKGAVGERHRRIALDSVATPSSTVTSIAQVSGQS